MRILPKILALVFSLFLIFHFSSFISPAFAQAQTEGSTPPSTNVDSNVPDTLHNWTQTVMIEVMSSLTCQLAGIDPTNPKQPCLGIDSENGKIGFLPSPETGGAIGFMGNMIAALYVPPAHGLDYFQNLAGNFGLSKKSYAQQTGSVETSAKTGIGFEGLRPLLGIWTGFRNIAYLVFVIVFVVIGLAIMLRIKIDPRTVMSIQNQIPKIIVGILLVTFSYAIGGFLIDIMYVSIHVVGNAIVSVSSLNPELPTQLARSHNPFQAAGNAGADGGNPAAGLWSIVFSPSKAVGEIVGSFIPVPNIFLVKGLFSWIAGTLAFIILAIALLIALFRLWFTLIFAYIAILLNIALAPFWIIGGLFPGSPINVSGWLRSLIANLAAFPATIAMFLLGKAFMDSVSSVSSTHFVPPLIGDRGSPEAIGAIIGFGIILMTPNVVNMLKAALKAPKMDTGIGAAIGAGVGIPMSTGKSIGSTIMASKEITTTKIGTGGQAIWGERGAPKAFFGKFLGRS